MSKQKIQCPYCGEFFKPQYKSSKKNKFDNCYDKYSGFENYITDDNKVKEKLKEKNIEFGADGGENTERKQHPFIE